MKNVVDILSEKCENFVSQSVSPERDYTIDIIKGIGIISIVLGHAFNTASFFTTIDESIRRFLYIYHLAVFFWCSGYLWKQRNLKQFVYGVIKNQYIKTAVLCIASFALIPIFEWMDVVKYDINAIPRMLFSTAIYKPAGCLTGALWFMPFFTVANIVFWLLNCVKNDTGKGILCTILGIIGCFLVQNSLLGQYYFNDALLMQPVMFLGEMCRKHKKDLIKITSSNVFKWSWMCSAVVIVVINYYSGQQIELTKHEVYGILGFYPLTVLGLCFVISLTQVLSSSKQLRRVFVFCGKNSFWIMATHFWVFKSIDGLSGFIDKGINTEMFPISYGDDLHRIIYAVLGVLVPCLFVFGVNSINMICRRARERRTEG